MDSSAVDNKVPITPDPIPSTSLSSQKQQEVEHSNETTTADQTDCALEAGQKRKSEIDSSAEEPKTKQPRRQKQQRRDDDFRKDDLSSVEYYFENGLRKVKPYFFVYRAYAKGRWMHRPLLQVFVQEFQDRDEKYYRYAIENGLITINDEKKSLDYIVKNNDIMGHRIHRHEPAVTNKPIQIVHRQDDLLVINKPGGIPVHPAGRYRHNTVIHVLRKTLDVPRLFPANRLDRPTSGLMLIGLNPDKAREFEAQMKEGLIRKEYVCRVAGKFPDGEVVCDAPIKTISYKLSLNYVHGDGKECKTVFERLSYNGETSVVRCRPVTGRTHQIRVHLRFLGYPIANDPTYSDEAPWADLMCKGQTLNDEMADKIVQRALQVSPRQVGIWEEDAHEKVKTQQLGEDVEGKCSECGLNLSPDPRPENLYIWLHAWKYSGDGWSFETEMPEWAKDEQNTPSSSA